MILTDELFIGKGGHRAAYIHPDEPSKCVKIAFDPNDGDDRLRRTTSEPSASFAIAVSAIA